MKKLLSVILALAVALCAFTPAFAEGGAFADVEQGRWYTAGIERAFSEGVITGSGFDVNPKSLGYSTCTYVGISLEKGSMYKNVVERLNQIPEIVECHFTTGPYTMLTKLYARDNEHLMDLLNNQLQEIPGVVSTETLISLEQSIKKEIPIQANKSEEQEEA